MTWHRTSRQSRGYGAEWQRLRKQILARDCYLCQACLRKDRVQLGNEVHHIRPRSQGRTNDPSIEDPSNLETLCGPCHLQADAVAQGRTLVSKRYRVALDGTLIEDGR